MLKYKISFSIFILFLLMILTSFEKNKEVKESALNNNFSFIGKSKQILENEIINNSEKFSNMEFGQSITEIAREFLGTPYLGGTLEGEPEICRINVEGLDCVTFFEISLNLTRMLFSNEKDINRLPQFIISTRYRNSEINDYTSRLHYTADWIYENKKNKIIDDISNKLGGIKYKFNVSFMSQNPQLYFPLQKHPELIEKIRLQETRINKRDYYIIPNEKVKMIESKLKSGDIIAIATSKKGLDYSHTGLIYINEFNEARFLHASSKLKKVVIDTTISAYIISNSNNIGISVLRPIPINKKN
jgi:hypothetical protein